MTDDELSPHTWGEPSRESRDLLVQEIRRLKGEVERVESQRDEWRRRANWWERYQIANGIDVRDLNKLADRHLPGDIAFDLHFASTTNAWFMRLRRILEGKMPPQWEI